VDNVEIMFKEFMVTCNITNNDIVVCDTS